MARRSLVPGEAVGMLTHASSPSTVAALSSPALPGSRGGCGDGAVLWPFVEGRIWVLGQAVPQESLDLWRVLR